MNREAKIQLLWHGKVTVDEIRSLLGQAAHIEIQLAPEYNHVLFSRLQPAAEQADAEDIDITGGVELLETVAGIGGLEAFSDLVEPLEQAGASVSIKSPPRVIIEIPGWPPLSMIDSSRQSLLKNRGKSTLTRTAWTRMWAHFHHEADIGVRGVGQTREEAFEEAAMALTAVITDPESVICSDTVTIDCETPDPELLFVDWLNALVFEMATRKMLFSRFHVEFTGTHLHATACGESVDVARHQPAAEIKGATYTELELCEDEPGVWRAQCVVDV